MRMNRLAAAGHAAPRKMLRRVAPGHVRLFPRHPDHLGGNALAVDHRLGAEVADAGVHVHVAVGLDDEQAVESGRAADETADRDADAAHLGAVALAAVRLARIPAELERALVERLLEEAARRVRAIRPRAFAGPNLRLACGRVDLPDLHLIDAELARSLGEDRLHDRDALHAAGLALRAARRRVGDRRDAAPPHRLGLEHQRRVAARRVAVAAGTVRPAFDDGEHVDRGDLAVLREADFDARVECRTRASDHVLFLAAQAHHHRRAGLLREQRRNDVGDRPGRLAAISAAAVLADEHDVGRLEAQPARDGVDRLDRALRRQVNVQLAVLPVCDARAALETLMARVRRDERLVEHQRGLLEARFDVAEATRPGRCARPSAAGPR